MKVIIIMNNEMKMNKWNDEEWIMKKWNDEKWNNKANEIIK